MVFKGAFPDPRMRTPSVSSAARAFFNLPQPLLTPLDVHWWFGVRCFLAHSTGKRGAFGDIPRCSETPFSYQRMRGGCFSNQLEREEERMSRRLLMGWCAVGLFLTAAVAHAQTEVVLENEGTTWPAVSQLVDGGWLTVASDGVYEGTTFLRTHVAAAGASSWENQIRFPLDVSAGTNMQLSFVSRVNGPNPATLLVEVSEQFDGTWYQDLVPQTIVLSPGVWVPITLAFTKNAPGVTQIRFEHQHVAEYDLDGAHYTYGTAPVLPATWGVIKSLYARR